MRPRSLAEFVGQGHLLDPGKFLDNAIKSKRLPSIILWGPPGTGKTTLAGLLAREFDAHFVMLSAVLSGVKDIRESVETARRHQQGLFKKPTILFVDEVHRFNKAQQDALLPHVERGDVTLIGATTENPAFEVNSALLSRTRVLVLESLSDEAIKGIVLRALSDPEHGLGSLQLRMSDDALEALTHHASGDARSALNTLEVAAQAANPRGAPGHIEITKAHIESAAQRVIVNYDKAGEQHYNIVSAFIKSLRGSDPDAAMHYMVRMLEGGEDPLFILRRMVIFASEDIGNADPRALRVALDATDAFRLMGLPEGVLPMTQAATYLACAPKSNAVLTAYRDARRDVLQHPNAPLPKHLLNAPTKLHKELGHGRGYKYPHNFEGNYVVENYLPVPLSNAIYYQPSDQGDEAKIRSRLEELRQARSNIAQGED